MSNTLTRPRRRPRVRSFRFRTLWWVLTREAAMRVLVPEEAYEGHARYWRGIFARRSTWYVRQAVRIAIGNEPSRRFTDGNLPGGVRLPFSILPSSSEVGSGGAAASGAERPQAAHKSL